MRVSSLYILLLLAPTPIVSHAAAIHDAALKGDVAAITAALDAGASVDEGDKRGTPLYLAVRGGHLAAAKLLIERGADVNAAPTPPLGPPLMPAVAKRNIDLINLLLDAGANANARRGGDTVLHIAVTFGCLDCVEALVKAGADVNARTKKDGKTPLHVAEMKGRREVADYLISHGVVFPNPTPISKKLAAADVEKGRVYFSRVCDGCHTVEPQGGSKSGPNLWKVVGRDKASVEHRYSDALRSWEGVWTYEDLNKFLLEPMATRPGVYMEMPGVPDETERVDLIAYLRTLSDKPMPLP